MSVNVANRKVHHWASFIVGDKLRLEHALAAPVNGRVGFWTKRDSITAFKGFSVR